MFGVSRNRKVHLDRRSICTHRPDLLLIRLSNRRCRRPVAVKVKEGISFQAPVGYHVTIFFEESLLLFMILLCKLYTAFTRLIL